jgi:hypothetical protein
MMKYLQVAAMGALASVALSCDGEDDGQHGQGTGTMLSMACTESGPECNPPMQSQGSVNATSLHLCNYWDSSSHFQVEFREPGTAYGVLVEIADFVGDGTYETNVDGTTNVTIAAPSSGDDEVWGDASGNPPSIPEHPCTIVAATNLEEITIPENGDANILDVDLDVSCPTLGWGAICPISCTVTPATFHLSVTGCLATQ